MVVELDKGEQVNPLQAFELAVISGAQTINEAKAHGIKDVDAFNRLVADTQQKVCGLISPEAWAAIKTLTHPNAVESKAEN